MLTHQQIELINSINEKGRLLEATTGLPAKTLFVSATVAKEIADILHNSNLFRPLFSESQNSFLGLEVKIVVGMNGYVVMPEGKDED